jgi:hypothetical protein
MFKIIKIHVINLRDVNKYLKILYPLIPVYKQHSTGMVLVQVIKTELLGLKNDSSHSVSKCFDDIFRKKFYNPNKVVSLPHILKK